MGIIVYDLDGTLRDGTCANHLIPEDKSNPPKWVGWQYYVAEHGTVLTACADYIRDVKYADSRGDTAYILTSSQFGTSIWLDNNNLPQPRKIIERNIHDRRHQVQYKKDWLSENAHDVVKWVDDSHEVCEYVRETHSHIEVVQVGAPSNAYHTPITSDMTKEEKRAVLERAREESKELDTMTQHSKASSPLDTQVGGDHYKKLKIQPAEYCAKNDIGFLEGSVVKYVTRHESKNGIEDINKAIHFLELIKNLKYGEQK